MEARTIFAGLILLLAVGARAKDVSNSALARATSLAAGQAQATVYDGASASGPVRAGVYRAFVAGSLAAYSVSPRTESILTVHNVPPPSWIADRASPSPRVPTGGGAGGFAGGMLGALVGAAAGCAIGVGSSKLLS